MNFLKQIKLTHFFALFLLLSVFACSETDEIRIEPQESKELTNRGYDPCDDVEIEFPYCVAAIYNCHFGLGPYAEMGCTLLTGAVVPMPEGFCQNQEIQQFYLDIIANLMDDLNSGEASGTDPEWEECTEDSFRKPAYFSYNTNTNQTILYYWCCKKEVVSTGGGIGGD